MDNMGNYEIKTKSFFFFTTSKNLSKVSLTGGAILDLFGIISKSGSSKVDGISTEVLK